MVVPHNSALKTIGGCRLALVVLCCTAITNTIGALQTQDNARIAKYNEMLKYMSQSADPCEDFYEFACGNPARNEKAGMNSDDLPLGLTALQAKIDEQLNNILSDNVTVNENPSYARRVKVFYKSCMTAQRNGDKQKEFFAKVITQNGGFPALPGANWSLIESNYNWLDTIIRLRYAYLLDILVKIRVESRNTSEYQTDKYLEPADTIIPAEFCNAEAVKVYELQHGTYGVVRTQVAENLSGWLTLDMKEARQVAAKLVALEYKLCAGIGLNDTNKEPANLQALSKRINQKMDFHKLVYNSFNTRIYKPFIVSSLKYFEHLNETMENEEKSTVANYIMYRALDMLSVPPLTNRVSYCLNTMKRYFPKEVGEMYHNYYVNEAKQADLQSIFNNIHEAFLQSVDASPWRNALYILRQLQLQMPTYPNTASTDGNPYKQMDPENFWTNLVEVLPSYRSKLISSILENKASGLQKDLESYDTVVIYSPEKLRIDMGCGLLQTPFYHLEYPVAVRYATIGQLLARELANAYAHAQRQQRHNQKLSHIQLNCTRLQISNYMYNNPWTYNNSMEVSELIVQSQALSIAFNGYLLWLQTRQNITELTNETIPNLNYTNTQLFFIAYAHIHCKAHWNATRPAILLSAIQQHTMEHYTINGPMMNSVEFARDFQCQAGMPMSADHKCINVFKFNYLL